MHSFFADKYIDWSAEKNAKLKQGRSISFEDIFLKIIAGEVLDVFAHPNKVKYPHQYVIVIEISAVIYLIPCVVDMEKIFLKTIYPSRKAKKYYKK